jgi:molybdenum cofactor cytidylyltransferase
MSAHRFVSILLAAGTGARFRAAGGQDLKLLAEFAPGRSVVRQACENLLHAGWPVHVIAGSEGARLRVALRGLDVTVWDLPSDRSGDGGLGASIRFGVGLTEEASGWLLALGDMPFVQAATMRAVARALESGASLAYPTYRGQRGHPVGFCGEWKDALLSLSGDKGARALVEAGSSRARKVEVNDSGVLQDVDVPTDLPAMFSLLRQE